MSGYDLLNLEKEENRLINNGGYKDLYRLLTNQPGVLPKKVGSVKKLEAVNREAEQQATEKDKKQQKELADREIQPITTDDLSSECNINYKPLRDLLEAGKWQAADQEACKDSCLPSDYACRLRVIDTAVVKHESNVFDYEELKDFVDVKFNVDGSYDFAKLPSALLMTVSNKSRTATIKSGHLWLG